MRQVEEGPELNIAESVDGGRTGTPIVIIGITISLSGINIQSQNLSAAVFLRREKVATNIMDASIVLCQIAGHIRAAHWSAMFSIIGFIFVPPAVCFPTL